MDALEFANGVWKALQAIRNLTYEDKAGPKKASGGLCAFGKFNAVPDSDPPAKAVSGGTIYAGPLVENMDPYEVDDSSDGTFVIWIEVDFIPISADGVLLSGIDSASTPTWGQGTSYPDQVAPTIVSGSPTTGTAVVAIGVLTVMDGAASFVPSGCGDITITHCLGLVSHTRH
jgi:hypothetical protein